MYGMATLAYLWSREDVHALRLVRLGIYPVANGDAASMVRAFSDGEDPSQLLKRYEDVCAKIPCIGVCGPKHRRPVSAGKDIGYFINSTICLNSGVPATSSNS